MPITSGSSGKHPLPGPVRNLGAAVGPQLTLTAPQAAAVAVY